MKPITTFEEMGRVEALIRKSERDIVMREVGQQMKEMAEELHAAINEPMYAGTRKDWIDRAYRAELKVEELEQKIADTYNEERGR